MTDLRRHVPPLTLHWDADAPGSLHQCVDGTLVFADVSGFTALTERLSRQGRIGAEEIVEALNRVFGPMLDIAAARGGELLKFGGDALLFLFRGEDHPEQACDAAVEMRASLRRAAAVPTSAGRFALSMSVGVHSGDVDLFLVGAPTRELLVLGPAASAVAQAEKTAEAGQVVVSTPTAARLSRGSTRPRDDGALLLRRRAPHTAAGSPPPPPAAPAALLSTLFPHALGDFLAPGPPDPEHRVATIAFVRFSGTDALLREEGAHTLATALDELVTGVEAALEAEGVTLLATDLDTDGGKFFLGSGVPSTHEDDEGRMLRALRVIADAGLRLPLQLGVARGHVFAAEVGVADRAAYSAMGDTTNTAARIMSTAPAGAVHAQPAVLERSRSLFAATARGPFRMKGKAAPVLVYEVGEETGTREAARAGRLPFLGRDQELTTARDTLVVALGGAGGVLVIEGPPGIGTTRLAQESLDAAKPPRRLILRAEPYGSSSAYRVLRDPLRVLLGIDRGTREEMGADLLSCLEARAPDLLPLAPLLADVVHVGVPATPEADRVEPEFRADRVADVVIALLDHVLPEPLALVVEDAHWADGASAHLLGRIAAATAGRPWGLLVVRRGDGKGFVPASGTWVALTSLAPDVVERLVIAATEATPLRPHEVAAVVAKADGNPLFVEEVTRAALGTGRIDALPESVQAAMGAQVDELAPGVRRILRYCAVLGLSVRREVLEGTLEADGLVLDPAMMTLLGGFVEHDGPDRLRFRTSLVRDAAYDGLAYHVRARIHRTAGEVLERMSTDLDADSPALVLHFARAGDAERTWAYAQRAGALARASFANADAADQFETALDVSRRVAGVTDVDRARLWTLVGELRELAGEFEASVDAHRRAARLLRDDPVAAAEVLVRQATAHERTGAFTSALQVVARARRLLRGADLVAARATIVKLDNLTALVRVEQERPQDARLWAERAAAEAESAGDHETLVRALMLIDFADLQLGVAGLGEHTRRALDICVEQGFRARESIARANLGAFAYYAGRWTEAAQWYSSSRQVALEAGNAFGAAETDVNLAELLINQGHLDGAEAILVDAVRVLRASGAVSFLAQGEMQLARVHLSRGDLSEAERRATAVVEGLRVLGQATSALEAALVLAEAVVRDGRAEEALAIIDRAERDAPSEASFSLPRTCLQRSRALFALDRTDEAGSAVAAGLDAAREQDLPYEEALLLRVRARLEERLGQLEAASTDRAEADRLLTWLGASA